MTGSYRCGGNLMWASMKSVAHVPADLNTLARVRTKYFPNGPPQQFPCTVIVGLSDPAEHLTLAPRGGLPRISPEEVPHALLLEVRDAINSGASEAELMAWRACMLNVPLEYRIVKSADDLTWQRINTREQFGTEYELFARSALGRIYEVIDVANQLSQTLRHFPSASRIASDWTAHVTLSGMSDPVTPGFVDTALTVFHRVISDPETQALIVDAEGRWGKQSPWNSVYKLEALAKKLGPKGDVARLRWMVAAVNDMALSDQVPLSELTVRTLSGKGVAANKGLLDLCLFKHSLLQHLRAIIPSTTSDLVAAEKMMAVTADHAAHRTAFGYPNNNRTRAG